MTLASLFQDNWKIVYNELKQPITIKSVTRNRDENDDISEDISETSTYGVVEEVGGDYIDADLGLLPTGSVIININPDETVNRADYITVGSNTYEVRKITTFNVAGTDIYKECVCQLKND